MATSTFSPDPTVWHAGNLKMQTLMHAPPTNNPTTPFLTPSRAALLSASPLLAIGALDDAGRPWTSLWGGESGFMRPLGGNAVGLRVLVDMDGDPLVGMLKGQGTKGDAAISGEGRRVSGLGIDLETRRRVKVAGEIAGAMIEQMGDEAGVGEARVIVKIESSLGE